jgi:hypothetical protein
LVRFVLIGAGCEGLVDKSGVKRQDAGICEHYKQAAGQNLLFATAKKSFPANYAAW